MSQLAPISCFNFSLQLIFCESLFLIGRKRQQEWLRRVVVSLLLYTVLAAAWYSVLHMIPGYRAGILIVYYLGLFAFTIPGIRLSYDLPWPEITFAATWNTDPAKLAAEGLGAEARELGVDGWYANAPAHRAGAFCHEPRGEVRTKFRRGCRRVEI